MSTTNRPSLEDAVRTYQQGLDNNEAQEVLERKKQSVIDIVLQSGKLTDAEISRATLLTEAYKGFLLVLGGGVVVLLTFLQAIWDKHPALRMPTLSGIGFMTGGLFLALVVPLFRFFHSKTVNPPPEGRKSLTWKWWAYTIGQFLSLGAFCVAVGILIVSGFRVPQSQVAPDVGRYQIIHYSGTSCFVIDTKTGRLWHGRAPSNGEKEPTWSENKVPWVSEGKDE
jgi:hypothetical protein